MIVDLFSGPRGWSEGLRLLAEPMRWLAGLRPGWVCLEEVPDVLPLWKQYALYLQQWGYNTWTGVLNAADYGVPQTRKRATR